MEPTKLGVAASILAGCGILTTSFSLTYGRWSEFHPVSHFINEHAAYIAATGLGLLCSLAMNLTLKKKIDALESVVDQMNREHGKPV